MVTDLPIVSYQDEDGAWIAEAPTLKGVHSCGKTQKEAVENLQEALDLYFEEQNEVPCSTNIAFKLSEKRYLYQQMKKGYLEDNKEALAFSEEYFPG